MKEIRQTEKEHIPLVLVKNFRAGPVLQITTVVGKRKVSLHPAM
jgi:hypothetical protein